MDIAIKSEDFLLGSASVRWSISRFKILYGGNSSYNGLYEKYRCLVPPGPTLLLSEIENTICRILGLKLQLCRLGGDYSTNLGPDHNVSFLENLFGQLDEWICL